MWLVAQFYSYNAVVVLCLTVFTFQTGQMRYINIPPEGEKHTHTYAQKWFVNNQKQIEGALQNIWEKTGLSSLLANYN